VFSCFRFHKFKNDDGLLATHLRHLRDKLGCLIIGLTGTIMQNDHDELWTAVDITNPGFFGSLSDFNQYYSMPIKLSR
jgi:SNF2 family DNA or RNA helicase